jgi:hypothetical protein
MLERSTCARETGLTASFGFLPVCRLGWRGNRPKRCVVNPRKRGDERSERHVRLLADIAPIDDDSLARAGRRGSGGLFGHGFHSLQRPLASLMASDTMNNPKQIKSIPNSAISAYSPVVSTQPGTMPSQALTITDMMTAAPKTIRKLIDPTHT